MREIVGNARAGALLEAGLDELQLAFDRRESREEAPPVLPLFGGERGDEQAVFQRSLAHLGGASYRP